MICHGLGRLLTWDEIADGNENREEVKEKYINLRCINTAGRPSVALLEKIQNWLVVEPHESGICQGLCIETEPTNSRP